MVKNEAVDQSRGAGGVLPVPVESDRLEDRASLQRPSEREPFGKILRSLGTDDRDVGEGRYCLGLSPIGFGNDRLGLRDSGESGDVEDMGSHLGMIVEKIHIVGGIYFRSILINKDVSLPQHTHNHDHATYVGSGSVRLWINGVESGDYFGGDAVEIKGGSEHLFMALEDNTRLVCVWPESIGEELDEIFPANSVGA